MPSNSPAIKKTAVEGYGGCVTQCEPTLEARESTCAKLIETTGATLVHPYDDARVIAGQGTAALELLEKHPDLDAIMKRALSLDPDDRFQTAGEFNEALTRCDARKDRTRAREIARATGGAS